MSIELTVLISAGAAISGAVLGILGYRRAGVKEAQDSGKNDGILLTEVGYVKAGVDDIKQEQKRQREEYTELKVNVARIEASAKQAHKRIDRLKSS